MVGMNYNIHPQVEPSLHQTKHSRGRLPVTTVTTCAVKLNVRIIRARNNLTDENVRATYGRAQNRLASGIEEDLWK